MDFVGNRHLWPIVFIEDFAKIKSLLLKHNLKALGLRAVLKYQLQDNNLVFRTSHPREPLRTAIPTPVSTQQLCPPSSVRSSPRPTPPPRIPTPTLRIPPTRKRPWLHHRPQLHSGHFPPGHHLRRRERRIGTTFRMICSPQRLRAQDPPPLAAHILSPRARLCPKSSAITSPRRG